MLTDKDISKLALPLITTFNQLELDLLLWIADRFALYSYVGGDLEWKLTQLSRLGGLDKQAINLIAEASNKSFTEVYQAIETAGIKSVDYKTYRKVFDEGQSITTIDDVVFTDVVSEVYGEVGSEMRLMYQEISKNVPTAYRRILDQVNLETTQGIYDYNTSLKKALSKLSNKGITAMTYERTVTDDLGNRIKVPVEYSIEGVARRTIVSAIVRSANAHNEKVAVDLGSEYYATSQHLGARNKGTGHVNHESWQGKYFQIANNEFARMTGEGLVDGLGGANCRHIKFAYFPGISVPIKKEVDAEENDRVYQLEQKQRRLERNVRNAKKQLQVAVRLEDKDYINESQRKVRDRQKKLKAYVDKHDELVRDYSREKIQEK